MTNDQGNDSPAQQKGSRQHHVNKGQPTDGAPTRAAADSFDLERDLQVEQKHPYHRKGEQQGQQG